MLDIVLDGNILGLQVHGGVSGYMARLYVEFTRLRRRAVLIQPRDLTYRGFGAADVAAAPSAHRERLIARGAQYLPARTGRRDVVFHSAYYRRPARRVARHVVTVHDFTYERFRSGPALWIHHRIKAAAVHAADAVICISEATRRDTLEFFPTVDPSRLHVIPHGVDLRIFGPDPAGAPEGLDRTVLYVGQRVTYKRFDLAMNALALLPDLRFGFVGPPPTMDEVAALNRILPDRWTWFGQVDDTMLRALYASAYAFIFPSDYEGFGLPVLEAMACGCPVLTSADRALREVGGAATLIADEQQPEAYATALRRLGTTGVRTALMARGLEIATRSTWQECARRTLAVFDADCDVG